MSKKVGAGGRFNIFLDSGRLDTLHAANYSPIHLCIWQFLLAPLPLFVISAIGMVWCRKEHSLQPLRLQSGSPRGAGGQNCPRASRSRRLITPNSSRNGALIWYTSNNLP